VPENLSVPRISTSSTDVSAWNKRSKTYLDGLFIFTNANLYDEGVLVIAHAADSEVPAAIHNWAYSFNFYVADEWFGISEFDLQSPMIPLAVVCVFGS